MKYINRNISIPEIFEIVSKLDTIEEKVNLLKQYDRRDLRWVVDFMYNADKTGLYIPDYKPGNFVNGMSYMSIGSALQKIEAALNNKHNKTIYERNLIIVLENVHKEEAQLLTDIFQGKKIEGVSKQVFKRVYPAFFRESDQEVAT